MAKSSRPSADARQRSGWPIGTALAVTFGSLVFLISIVLLVVLGGLAARSTYDLITTRAELAIGTIVARTRDYARVPAAQVDYLALMLADGLLADGRLEGAETARLEEILAALLGTVDTVDALVVVDRTGTAVRAAIVDEAGRTEVRTFRLGGNAPLRQRLRGNPELQGPELHWDEPVLTGGLGSALPVSRAVVRDGEVLGHVEALVTVRALSRAIGDVATLAGQTPFILFRGDRVLAHPQLQHGSLDATRTAPLPALSDFTDPILRVMADPVHPPTPLGGLDRREATLDGTPYVFLSLTATGSALPPVTIGSYFARASLALERERLLLGFAMAVAATLVAVLVAVLLGRRFARGIARLGAAARDASRFAFAPARALPPSSLRELEDARRSFRAMGGALEAAARYLPRRLVMQLLDRDREGAPAPFVARDLTIMFTDLSGFTAWSEPRTPAATATALNAHLDLVARAIEAEAGTVDKFLGDGVMAFWGAPDVQPDQADRALRAASAIAAEFRRANEALDVPFRLRIGIHRGVVVVGDIGGGSRVNYTIVGDPVNTTERLCALGKVVAPDAEVVTLLSGAVRRAATPDWALRSRGPAQLEGRRGVVELWELEA